MTSDPENEKTEPTVTERPADDGAIDLLATAARLWTGRRVLIKYMLVLGLVTGVVAYLLPLSFTAEASFIPPESGSGSSLMALTSQIGLGGGSSLLSGVKTPGEMYAGILQSKLVLDSLINKFQLTDVYHTKKMSQAETRLLSKTSVKLDTKQNIVYIKVTDSKPERARDLANGYLDALDAANSQMAITSAAQRRLFFERQLKSEKNALADAEVDLKRSQEATGVLQPAGQTTLQLRTIAETRSQIAARQVELAALRQTSTEQNVDVVRLKSQIANLEAQLHSMQSGSGEEGALPTAKVPEVALEVVRKEREVKYHETLFEMLARQYEAARLEEAKEGTIVQVLDRAKLPDMKSFPPRMALIAVGMMVGLMIGVFRILFLTTNQMEELRSRFRSTPTA
ncbi:GNVR domain-containing protein [Terriglobus sp. TAA 43]|uniref:GumC family protein n=1 Tax=Terriglobus sp. TAA 43 TaxID=278961 RepID=UPI000A013CC2|nr:GNVR domain-containing protein [Terriglobus sp. TAA 43]